MTRHRIFREIFKKILIHRAAVRKSTTLANWVRLTKAASSPSPVDSRRRDREKERNGSRIAITIKGRKALNDERRLFPLPPPSLPILVTFLEIRFGGYERVAFSRDRVCLRDREALFPVCSFKRAHDYGNAY